MIKFEKKFLYTFADIAAARELIGKEGLFFDSFILDDELINKELFELLSVEQYSITESYKNSQNIWRFFYYDPNLESKRAYYLEGKKIQWRNKDFDWNDCIGEPCWNEDTEYRIKPEPEPEPETKTYLTNRQVAEWLAKGNGQVYTGDNIYTDLIYDVNEEHNYCDFEIRKWSDDGWHEPTKEYISEVTE